MKRFNPDKVAALVSLTIICSVTIGFMVKSSRRSFGDYEIVHTHIEEAEKDVIAENDVNIETKNENSQENGNSSENLHIDINTDDINELQKLDGIGEKMAQRIINNRKQYGDFGVIEEVMRVPGIGKKRFEKIKENIYVK